MAHLAIPSGEPGSPSSESLTSLASLKNPDSAPPEDSVAMESADGAGDGLRLLPAAAAPLPCAPLPEGGLPLAGAAAAAAAALCLLISTASPKAPGTYLPYRLRGIHPVGESGLHAVMPFKKCIQH